MKTTAKQPPAAQAMDHCCQLSYFIARSGIFQNSFGIRISKLLLAGKLAILNIYLNI